MVFKDIKLNFVYTTHSILSMPSFVGFTLTMPVQYTFTSSCSTKILKTLSLKFRYFPKYISVF